MPTILCAMPERTFRRMMTPELENELRALGDILNCPDAHALSEDEYSAYWERADAALTGWGVRAPTSAMLERASRLRIISHTAGSVRMLPRAALEQGIVVTSARPALARTVAEFCLMTTLILLRRLPPVAPSLPNETLYGKTVGLIGFGHIARIFREHLLPFDCRVLAYDPFLSEEDAARHRVEQADLRTLLQTCKVVSLHAPDIPATRDLIGADELALLPDGAVFLNAARGRLVETEALTEALKTGRFFAAIDVTEPEPLPPDHPLRTLPNVLFTPHVAGPTEDELPQLTRMALTDLARFLRGEPPLHPISLAAYDLMSF